MTTFQWGKAKNVTNQDGQFVKGGPQIQVVVCLDCFDWCDSTPIDCRLWMIEHTEKQHPSGIFRREEINIYRSPEWDERE